MDENGDIKLSDVLELIKNSIGNPDDGSENSFDLYILTCLTYPGSRMWTGDYEDEDEYDDREFNCRSYHRDITLHEDRYWNTGRPESICEDCWDGVPGKFKKYYTYVDGDNANCHYYNSNNGCKFGNDCMFKHV